MKLYKISDTENGREMKRFQIKVADNWTEMKRNDIVLLETRTSMKRYKLFHGKMLLDGTKFFVWTKWWWNACLQHVSNLRHHRIFGRMPLTVILFAIAERFNVITRSYFTGWEGVAFTRWIFIRLFVLCLMPILSQLAYPALGITSDYSWQCS